MLSASDSCDRAFICVLVAEAESQQTMRANLKRRSTHTGERSHSRMLGRQRKGRLRQPSSRTLLRAARVHKQARTQQLICQSHRQRPLKSSQSTPSCSRFAWTASPRTCRSTCPHRWRNRLHIWTSTCRVARAPLTTKFCLYHQSNTVGSRHSSARKFACWTPIANGQQHWLRRRR